MRHLKLFTLMIVAFSLLVPAAVMARGIEPVVSVEWLEKNLTTPNLVVVDIRKVEEYNAGHIPGAINIFYNILAPGKNNMRNELPADDDLRDVLSAAGITADSLVVFAGVNDTPSDRFSMTRAAMTFFYAGVPNVAVLDGGTTKWAADGKALSTDAVKPKPKDYKGKFNKGIFLNKDAFAGKVGTALVVDVREPAFFNGEKKLEFVARTGHIKGAVNLPAGSLLFSEAGTYKPMADLKALAVKVLGEDLGKEIVLYCDTGKVATGWWLPITQAFGYTDVKVYDGSSEEWSADPNLPME
jgi:thiosulfate/3-mercaptopyruvate sulfurtransferase